MGIQDPGQFVLERSSVTIDASTGAVEARFTVGLPAAGRRRPRTTLQTPSG